MALFYRQKRVFKQIQGFCLLGAALLTLMLPSAAQGITPKQEEELATEFLKMASRRFTFIDDPLILDYVNQVGRKIVSVLPVQPFGYHFYIVKSDVYNAFAIPAGHIFLHSGLLEAMESEDELAGILCHEIAHVSSRHISDKIERSKAITAATLAGVVAGAFLGIGGSADAAQAVTSGAIAAGQSFSLAYSREDERQADQLGLRYMADAGYRAQGLLSVLKKIRSKQWYDNKQFPDYLSTHPGSEERMATIGSWLDARPDHAVSQKPQASYAFLRVHARLLAVYGDEESAWHRFAAAVERDPGDPVGQYGYGLVMARKGKLDDAAVHLRKALEKRAFDPYILNDLGRVYFLQGNYEDALNSLKGTIIISAGNPEALFLLGRIQMERGQLADAVGSLEQLIALKPDYPQAAFFLGNAYGQLGRMGPAGFFLGLHYKEKGDRKNALFHLRNALRELDDPDRKAAAEKMVREIEAEREKGDS